jgi:hypothetical protein
MDAGTLKLVLFTFVISLLFPVFAFSFTNFGADWETYDVTTSLNQDTLTRAGITLKEGLSRNITFRGAYAEYPLQNLTIRINWVRQPVLGDYFLHRRRSFVGRILDNWALTKSLSPKIGTDTLSFNGLDNATVINNFNPEFNWTEYKIIETGLSAFITTLPKEDNNITLAVQEIGNVTITVGKQVSRDQEWNFTEFIDWYWSIIIGANDWGMPSFMNFLIRVISGLTFLSGVLLLKDLTRL